jgi:hypothetical protein
MISITIHTEILHYSKWHQPCTPNGMLTKQTRTLVSAFLLAPASSSSRKWSEQPFTAAQCSAAHPPCVHMSSEYPADKSNHIIKTSILTIAQIKLGYAQELVKTRSQETLEQDESYINDGNKTSDTGTDSKNYCSSQMKILARQPEGRVRAARTRAD